MIFLTTMQIDWTDYIAKKGYLESQTILLEYYFFKLVFAKLRNRFGRFVETAIMFLK